MLALLALGGPLGAESTPTDPFVISTDSALYGKRVSQQIPALARVGTRWFCIWYGVNHGEPGTSGEGSGCYNLLAISDDGCRTWREAAYFVPNPAVQAQSIIDPRLVASPDGSLVLLIPVSGQKRRTRSTWSVVLTNPLAQDAPFVFGEPKFVDYGFVGSPAVIDGQIYFTVNQNASGAPPYPESQGMKLHCVTSLAGGQIATELVSRLPYAAADGSLNTFFEASLAQRQGAAWLACFRTSQGQYLTRSEDAGRTWAPAAPWTAQPNAPGTKADLARSPSGRLVMAFNRTAGGRYNMCVALSADGGETWPQHYVFDPRQDPGTSYPNVAFGAGADGRYDGQIYVAYDHGRGKKAPFTKEIVVTRIDEEGVWRGEPQSETFVVSQ